MLRRPPRRRPEPPAPGPSGSMGGARDVGWVAAGLVLGAGACYCLYRLTRSQRRGGRGLRLRPSRSAGEAGGTGRWAGPGRGVEDAPGAQGFRALGVREAAEPEAGGRRPLCRRRVAHLIGVAF